MEVWASILNDTHLGPDPGARVKSGRVCPSKYETGVRANGDALARYGALSQEQELVPVVEPEVLMDGSHTKERYEEVTGIVLHAVFHALFKQNVALDGMLLKPNMVIAGKKCVRRVHR